MARFEYDDQASAREHVDVVHEVTDEGPSPVSRWVTSMQRLNAINDPLARRLIALHRDCGSGTGVCDDTDEEPTPLAFRSGWGCDTLATIADHFQVAYPPPR